MRHNQIGVKTIHKQAVENAIIAEYYRCSSGVVIYLSIKGHSRYVFLGYSRYNFESTTVI